MGAGRFTVLEDVGGHSRVLPGNVKIDGNRRRATVSGRPPSVSAGLQLAGIKLSFAIRSLDSL